MMGAEPKTTLDKDSFTETSEAFMDDYMLNCNNSPQHQPISYYFQVSNIRKTHCVQDDHQSSDHENSSDDEYLLHKLGERSSDPIKVQMLLNGKKLDMVVDTGATLTLPENLCGRDSAPLQFSPEDLHR